MSVDWPAQSSELWPIENITPYARNSRTHSDEQVAQIAASIREWGWTNPILVDEEGGLTAGGLAAWLGVTPRAVFLWEAGERGISGPVARLMGLLARFGPAPP